VPNERLSPILREAMLADVPLKTGPFNIEPAVNLEKPRIIEFRCFDALERYEVTKFAQRDSSDGASVGQGEQILVEKKDSGS